MFTYLLDAKLLLLLLLLLPWCFMSYAQLGVNWISYVFIYE